MSIKRHLPNAVTCCNLLCGCLAILFALYSDFFAAFLFVIFGALFDFADGLVARLLSAYSEIGKELDSLADVVTFGVAPAIAGVQFILYASTFYDSTHLDFLCFVPLVLAPMSALRLAKFNIDSTQSAEFKGVPTPASAMVMMSFIVFVRYFSLSADSAFESAWLFELCSAILSVILSIMMVSPIPMFSFKFKSLSFQENRVRFIFAGFAIALILCSVLFVILGVPASYPPSSKWAIFVSMSFFLIFFSYIVYNLLVSLLCRGAEKIK